LYTRTRPYVAAGLALSTLAIALLLASSIYSAFAGGADTKLRHALLGGVAGMGATALGALIAVMLRDLSERLEDSLLGFAAGMMLAASCFSLILPGVAAAEEITQDSMLAALVVVAGLLLGALLMLGLGLDQFTPHEHARGGPCGPWVRAHEQGLAVRFRDHAAQSA